MQTIGESNANNKRKNTELGYLQRAGYLLLFFFFIIIKKKYKKKQQSNSGAALRYY